jgi:hypothetical protein
MEQLSAVIGAERERRGQSERRCAGHGSDTGAQLSERPRTHTDARPSERPRTQTDARPSERLNPAGEARTSEQSGLARDPYGPR